MMSVPSPFLINSFGSLLLITYQVFSPHITSVQYCGGCSVHRGDNISTVGDSFSTVGGQLQYCGGCSVQWGDNISTCGGITSVLWGITSILWRVFSTVEGYLQYCGGITAVHVGG